MIWNGVSSPSTAQSCCFWIHLSSCVVPPVASSLSYARQLHLFDFGLGSAVCVVRSCVSLQPFIMLMLG